MKQNLLFQKMQKHSKQTFIAIFCFITSSAFAQNPLLLKSPVTGGAGKEIHEIVSTASGKVFFTSIDRNNHFSDSWGLWVTDGTKEGTKKITLTSPPVPGGTNSFTSKEATLLATLGSDKIIFTGDNESGYGEVWVSDGTQAGTYVLEQFVGASGQAISNVTKFGNEVIYSVLTSDSKVQLHKTNGTYAGTSLVYDFGVTPLPAYFKVINGILYFELNVVQGANMSNSIWRSDGTTAGTYQVKDLGLGYGFASDFMSFKNNIYFITISSTYGDYLWKSDGTSAGTAPLKQIATSFQQDNLFPSYAAVENSMILPNNLLYFAANDGVHGKELWKTDGTAAGTTMTFDFNPGATGSNPQWLTVLNDQLYFSATSSIFPGTNLYYYNGTQFSQPIQQNNLSYPTNLAVVNNTILFSGIGSTFDGNELWFGGGSTPNTLEISNINATANASSNPSLFSVSGSNVYFAASYDVNRDGIDEPCIFKYTIPEKIWTGAVNTDVSAIDNWFPSGAPSATDNVLIPLSAPASIAGGMLQAKDLANHGSINLNSGGIVLIGGNFYNDGQVVNTNNGIFAVIGAGDHWIGNSGIYNGQLTISGGTNIHLLSDFKVNDFRNEGGVVYLGDYHFQYDTYKVYPPRFVTDGNGFLTMIVGGIYPTNFSVGTDANSSNPVTLVNHGDWNYFNVNVKNGVYTNGTSGNAVTAQAVNKTWLIEPVSPGNYNVDVTLQWNAADELPGFDRSHIYLNHYTNGAWDNGTQGAASGTGPYTFFRNGITSFSPFTVSSSTSALPVNLVSFTANQTNNSVQLNWQTISEKNFSFFSVERSKDGMIFSPLGEVAASFNNAAAKNYSFADQQPLQGVNYYRLKMVDKDGHFTYSKIVSIKADSNNNLLQVFPNPAKDILNVHATGSDNNILLQIIDMAGRKIMERKITLNGVTSLPIDISKIPKGTYTLLLKGNSVNEQRKFVKE